MYKCDRCGRKFPTKRGLSVHRGRYCKRRKRIKKSTYIVRGVLGAREFYCSHCGKKNYVKV